MLVAQGPVLTVTFFIFLPYSQLCLSHPTFLRQAKPHTAAPMASRARLPRPRLSPPSLKTPTAHPDFWPQKHRCLSKDFIVPSLPSSPCHSWVNSGPGLTSGSRSWQSKKMVRGSLEVRLKKSCRGLLLQKHLSLQKAKKPRPSWPGSILQNCCSTTHLLTPDMTLALCQPVFSKKGSARACQGKVRAPSKARTGHLFTGRSWSPPPPG